MRKLVIFFVLCSLFLVVDSHALTQFFSQDLGVKGNMRHCKYSNGKIYTVNAMELCPMSIEEGGPSFSQATGFLAGEYQDGMTKVCVYNVMGNKKALRLNSYELCPLNSKF